MRIIRYDISSQEFKFENQFYRNIARSLSQARDSAAIVETINDLMENKPKSASLAILSQLKNEACSTRNNYLAENNKVISGAACLMKNHPIITNDLKWGVDYKLHLSSALKTSYRQASESHQICLNDISDTNIHEYRKKAKHFRYQLMILQNIWPPMFQMLEHEFHKLTYFLGQANNLTVLQNYTAQSSILEIKGIEKFKVKLEKSKIKLAQSALESGHRLFAETNGQFGKRIQVYVNHWKAL